MALQTVIPPNNLILGISLKLYFDLTQTVEYTARLSRYGSNVASNNLTLFLLPDAISIHPCAQILSDMAGASGTPPILLGAQDSSPYFSGPHTGQISPLILHQAGARITCLGHAERRAPPLSESNALIAAKAAAAVNAGLIPLICVGEVSPPGPVASSAVGKAVAECMSQLLVVLHALPAHAEVWIAYEPVWAIGAKEPASAGHVVAVTKALRRLVDEGTSRTGGVKILYGGAAGPGTWEGVKESVDGLFLGRFAHDFLNLDKVIREMGIRTPPSSVS